MCGGGGGVGGGHESHLTRPFPLTVIPADSAVRGWKLLPKHKQEALHVRSPLSGFSV